MMVVCTAAHVLKFTYLQACLYFLPTLSPLVMWFQCQYLKTVPQKNPFGYLSCCLCAVGSIFMLFIFSGFLFCCYVKKPTSSMFGMWHFI